jgi:hypothetical protein
MTQNKKDIYITAAIFVVIILTGFYLVFNRLAELQEEFKNFELAFELYKKEKASAPPVPQPNPPTSTNGSEMKKPEPVPNQDQESAIIPTAILFEAQSSATSFNEMPVKLNISVENVARSTNGTIEVALKIFNGDAQNYARLDPLPLFEIIDLQNTTVSQEPYKIEGPYDSIPPRGAILGKVFFKVSSSQNTIILRVGEVETASFYEFDFQKKSYKEISVG